MLLGFAATQHCNLRCPHCIRDDVETVHEIEPELVSRVVDDAIELWGDLTVSLTGGEPLIHRRFADLIDSFRERRVPWRMVSNGWHLGRIVPILEGWPPESIRLSLSGATRQVHDADRGRGSFDRVLLSLGILTHLRIPAALTIVIDRRDRHQIRQAADLAEALGCPALHYILPQPVPGSAARDSDLPPSEWLPVKREIDALARDPERQTRLRLDYGELLDDPLADCSTFALERVYVDARGRLSLCCQLSEYGLNENDVVADLHEVSLHDAWPLYLEQLGALRSASRGRAAQGDAYDQIACIRCARCTGKLDWLSGYPASPWASAAAVV
jgi:MoaA/NifB/PqqE/SkfB family radical SAM enzyme